MRKLVIVVIVAVVIAAGALGYYKFSGQQTGSSDPSALSGLFSSDMAELAYVPADTAVFAAQLKPIDLASYLASLGVMYGKMDTDEIAELLQGDEFDEPGLKFALVLFQNYMEAVKQPATFSTKIGAKPSMRSLFYMVGISPVARFEVADEAQFWLNFDAAEKESGFKHILRKLDTITYRDYVLDEEDKISLLVSVNAGWATLTLHSGRFDSNHLATALATVKPTDNLSASGKLKEYTDKYQLGSDSVGFVSTEQLAKAFTTFDGNRLAKDFELLFGKELAESLTYWRADACQREVGEIAALWPGIFIAAEIDQSQPNKAAIKSKVLIPTADAPVLSALQAIRGFIPANLNGNLGSSLFYMALGVDIIQLAPNLNQLWASTSNANLTCTPLVGLQNKMKEENPLAALAVLGMANGLQSTALTVNSLEFDPRTQQPKNVDALLSMSATNVRGLFEMVKAFLPMLADVQLPAAGKELDLNSVIPYGKALGVSPKIRATDSHFMAYLGEQSKSDAMALSNEKLSKNGLFVMGIDYAKFYTVLAASLESSGLELPEEVQQALNKQTTQKLKMFMAADINEQGVVFTNSFLMEQ